MSDDPIKAALEVATKARCCWGRPCLVEAGEMRQPCCMPFHARQAAATVTAFLRALPAAPHWRHATINARSMELLAAAVERAAKEAGDE